MSKTLKLSIILPASQERVYSAWLSSEDHSAFTGSEAHIDAEFGGKFSAWDNYISGTTLQLLPYSKIVQAWRTTEFPDNSPDSKLEIHFEPVGAETKLTLIHSEIPEGQEEEYEQGWTDYYFEPMKKYFADKK